MYDKPLLSMAMARQISPDKLVRESGAAARMNLRLLARPHAISISADSQQLRTTRGTLRYDQLVLAHVADPLCGRRQRRCRGKSLAWKNGIEIDPHTLRTSQSASYAMGDCISIHGQASRYIEPIARQAKTIAAAIAGSAPEPYEQRPVIVRVKTTSLPLTLH